MMAVTTKTKKIEDSRNVKCDGRNSLLNRTEEGKSRFLNVSYNMNILYNTFLNYYFFYLTYNTSKTISVRVTLIDSKF